MSFFVRLLVVAAVIALIWWATRPRYDFRISIDGQEVSLEGRMAQARWSEVSHFLRQQRDLGRRVRISGRRRPDGRWQFRFAGPLAPAQQQRIRNFLLETL